MRSQTILLLAAALPLTPQEAPTIKITTRMVQVNVIVRDKKGPVSDLKKEDFTLLEQGKPRTIASFSVAASANTPAPTGAAKLPPNIFSNQMDRDATSANNVTVVLLDGLNTPIADQAYARKAVIQFLESLHREDRIALYVLGGTLRVLHDFTSDYDQLRAAIARSKGENIGHLDASEPDVSDTGTAIDDFLNGANQKISDFYTVDRVRRTTEALEAIARHVSSVPGRKNLVWVSGSFPFSIGLDGPMGGTNEQRTFSDEIQRATRRLNQANLAVYPVDARGLVGLPKSMTAAAPSRSIRAGAPPPKINFRPTGLDTMDEIASRTGGKAFYNTNDIRGAIVKATEDAELTYTLGFYPASEELDGKFHELKVKVARSGVDVRYRKGYLAVDSPVPTDKQQLDDLKAAAVGPLDLTEIAVSTRVDVVNEPKPGTLQLTMLIDAHDLQLEKIGEKWTGKAQLMILQVGADQKIVGNLSEAFKINLTDDQYKAILQKGMLIAKRVEPAKDVKQVRVLMQDKTTGKIGSLRMPVAQILAAKPPDLK